MLVLLLACSPAFTAEALPSPTPHGYERDALMLEQGYFGSIAVSDQVGRTRVGFLGNGVRDRFGKYEESRRALESYRSNNLKFVSAYLPGILLMCGAGALVQLSDRDEVGWAAFGGGVALSLVGLRFFVNARNDLFKGIWEYNKAVAGRSP